MTRAEWIDDYFDDECEDGLVCPHCGGETRQRECNEIGCEDGFIDGYEDDPCWYLPGEFYACPECRGTGVVAWCVECSRDPRIKPEQEAAQ